MATVAKDFQKIIHDGRERKKNEALAERIFSRNRRQSAPSKLKASASPSLASRVGIKKSQPQQRLSNADRRTSLPSGNVNGEWTHDLHDSVTPRTGSLGSRVTLPGGAGPRKQRKSRLGFALDRMDTDDLIIQPQVNIIASKAAKPAQGPGITIRGLAGPFAVMGQNFAPGTTAADIESAMTPVGGEMASCHIVKTNPFLIFEMVFASREGGERVIETFNNKTADGRLIKVYPKVGATYQQPSVASERNNPPANAPSGPRSSQPSRAANRDQVVDGSMGFSDAVESDNFAAPATSNRPLYSDKIVAGNRRGRGFQRGRGGR